MCVWGGGGVADRDCTPVVPSTLSFLYWYHVEQCWPRPGHRRWGLQWPAAPLGEGAGYTRPTGGAVYTRSTGGAVCGRDGDGDGEGGDQGTSIHAHIDVTGEGWIFRESYRHLPLGLRQGL